MLSIYKLVLFISISLLSACFVTASEPTLVAGPESCTIEKKGSMVLCLCAENLDTGSAHSLRLSFHPSIKAGSIKVKFFKGAGSLTEVLIDKDGHRAAIDIDPGPSSLKIYLEEQGMMEKKLMVFARLLRLPPDAVKKPSVAKSGQKPRKLEVFVSRQTIKEEEKDLIKNNFSGKRRKYDKWLKEHGLDAEQVREFLFYYANAMICIKKALIGPATSYLLRAEKIYKCAEICYWRAVAIELVKLDRATEELAKALKLLDEGKTVASLLGDKPNQLAANIHGLAATFCLQKAAALPPDEISRFAKLKGWMEKHLRAAAKKSPETTKEKCEKVRAKWRELAEKRKQLREPPDKKPATATDKIDPGVEAFLRARRLADEDKILEALRVIAGVDNLPDGDTEYLKAEIFLKQGRKERARKALEKSIGAFDSGRCLAGIKGGKVKGTRGIMPPASVRAALARVSLARYWAEKFASRFEDGNVSGRDERKEVASLLERSISLMEEALGAVPTQESWRSLLNAYREARLKCLYPSYQGDGSI